VRSVLHGPSAVERAINDFDVIDDPRRVRFGHRKDCLELACRTCHFDIVEIGIELRAKIDLGGADLDSVCDLGPNHRKRIGANAAGCLVNDAEVELLVLIGLDTRYCEKRRQANSEEAPCPVQGAE
jgi:hypothetical protein